MFEWKHGTRITSSNIMWRHMKYQLQIKGYVTKTVVQSAVKLHRLYYYQCWHKPEWPTPPPEWHKFSDDHFWAHLPSLFCCDPSFYTNIRLFTTNVDGSPFITATRPLTLPSWGVPGWSALAWFTTVTYYSWLHTVKRLAIINAEYFTRRMPFEKYWRQKLQTLDAEMQDSN